MKLSIHRRILAMAASAALVLAGLALGGTARAAAADESTDGNFTVAAFADYPDSSTPLSLRTALSGNFVTDEPTLRVGSARKAALPDGDEYSWLGKAGAAGWYTGNFFASPAESDVPFVNPGFYIDPSQLAADDAAQQLGVQKVDGPGTFAWYEVGPNGAAGTSAAPIDGLRLGTGTQRDGSPQQATLTVPGDASSTFQNDMVARFSAAGMYCITFSYSAHPASSASRRTVTDTLRFAVGDSVAADAPCGTAADGGGSTTPPGGGGTTPPGGGGTTPPPSGDPNGGIGPDGNAIWTDGHVDSLYPTLDTAPDGTKKLKLRALDSKVRDLDDVVYYSSDAIKQQLPATYTKDADYSFAGSPGQTVWNSPETQVAGAPWMGLSTQSKTLDELGAVPYSYRLDAVTGPGGTPAPGDVAMWEYGSESGTVSAVYASTRVGLPGGWQEPANAHVHTNWTFTKPGVYCMAFTVEAPLPDGTRQSDREQLTMAIGSSVDPATVRPCGHTQPYPGSTAKPLVTDPTPGPVLVDRGFSAFVPRLADGKLSVGLRREDSYVAEPGRTSDIDDSIVHMPFGARLPYDVAPVGGRDQGLQVAWDATGVPSAAVRGDITWTLDPHGPGGIRDTEYVTPDQHPFDTIGARRNSRALWPGSEAKLSEWNVSRPGKYCIGMTWGATLADGTPVSDHHVLTLVVDGPLNPKAYTQEGSRYVATGPVFTHKADTLTKTCADGAQPTTASEVPVGGTGSTPPASGGGGGTRPVSGRDVLRIGHMDVLSTVTQAAAGNTLGVRIHDDNTSPATLHDPNKSTFYAAEGARTLIPSDAKFSFLGKAGRPVWVLPQTQDPKLLWPGWNVDLTKAPAAKNVQWSLNAVKGPGAFALFENNGFGDVKVLLDSDGPQKSFAYHEHAHANWAFGADGVYCLDSTFAAQPSSLQAAQRTTLLVAVGNVDPSRVTPADCGKSAAQVGTGTTAKPTGGASKGNGKADPLGVTLNSVAHHGIKSSPAHNPCTAQQVRSSHRADVDVASSGHFDFGSRVIDGALHAAVKDGRKEPATWRDTSGLVFDVGSAAKQTVPAGYPFLGRAGGSVWVIPQTQLPNIPWLGWNTQDPSVITGTTGPVTFSVTGLSGPGTLAVYTTGSFGGVENKVFGTASGFPRSFTVAPNVHAHANWAFTEPGVYRLNMTQTATLRGGKSSSSSATLTFSVGRSDPAAAAPTVVTTHTVGRTGDGQACTLSADQLRTASTGLDVRTGLLLGLGVLLAGAVTMAAARRRRRA